MLDYDANYEWWAETREMVIEQAKYHVEDWVFANVNNTDAMVYFFEVQGLDPFGLATIMLEHTSHAARVKAILNEYEQEVEEFLICSDAFHKKMEAMRMGDYDL